MKEETRCSGNEIPLALGFESPVDGSKPVITGSKYPGQCSRFATCVTMRFNDPSVPFEHRALGFILVISTSKQWELIGASALT